MAQDAPLQPLRVPAGWTVVHNDFRVFESLEDARREHMLREDLAQFRHEHLSRTIDLGWYPEGDVAGAFQIHCVEPDFHGRTLEHAQVRDQSEAVAALERMLHAHGRP